MKFGVVILNWNNATDTIACVLSIRLWHHTWTPTIIVVDNHSASGDVNRIEAACPEAVLAQAEYNLGFGGGTNIGVQIALETSCDAVLLLNNDARIDQENVERLVQSLKSTADLGVVGPILLDGDKVLSAGGRDISRHVVTHLQEIPRGGRLQSVTYVPGTVALIRADVFRSIGTLDEAYFFGGEIADFCERAKLAGFTVSVDTYSHASHSMERSSGLRNSLHKYYALRNRFLFINKFRAHKKVRYYSFWTLIAVVQFSKALLLGDFAMARIYRLALIDGLRGRFGGQNTRIISAP